jgi:DNA-binding response OmpR family regulator
MLLPELPADGKSFRILLVEDDEAVARLVLINLQHAGFDARLAADGNAGWHAFNEINPHLVITDVVMPGLSGWDLATKIRDKSGVPIIILAASASDHDQLHGFKIGVDDYVVKPFHPPLLLARVIAHLRRVYRYDAAATPPAPPAPPRPYPVESPSIPRDWTQCEACSYLGPSYKFEALDPVKGLVFICPNCKNRTLNFSLG